MIKKTLISKFNNYTTEIPYYEFGDEYKGEHLYISGGIHGNEINGIALAVKVLHWLESEVDEQALKGKLTIIPVLNPSGFNKGKREVAYDNCDLNRQFGFDKPNSFSQQIANDLTKEILQYCSAGVDCHDSGSSAALVPHSRVHISDEMNCVSCTREMAQLLGTDIVLEREGEEHMMAVFLNERYKIEALTIEMGGGGIIDEVMLNKGFEGIKNILRGYQLIEGRVEIPKRQEVLPRREYKIAPFAGMFYSDVKLGDKVIKGQMLGKIYSPVLNETYEVISDVNGFIFSLQMVNQVRKRDTLCSILTNNQ